MGLLNTLFGFRWSLYIVANGNQLAYAMHENSVIRLLTYLMEFYSDGKQPIAPWSLCLNYNKTHQLIKLGPEHFTSDGNPSPLLIEITKSIDPNWSIKGDEPVFEEAATRKRLKIQNTIERFDATAINEYMSKLNEPTFVSVMNKIFGRS